MVSNKSLSALGIIPSSDRSPIMVWVLPEAVWPYAKSVPERGNDYLWLLGDLMVM